MTYSLDPASTLCVALGTSFLRPLLWDSVFSGPSSSSYKDEPVSLFRAAALAYKALLEFLPRRKELTCFHTSLLEALMPQGAQELSRSLGAMRVPSAPIPRVAANFTSMSMISPQPLHPEKHQSGFWQGISYS